jgi:hypothetical protein
LALLPLVRSTGAPPFPKLNPIIIRRAYWQYKKRLGHRSANQFRVIAVAVVKVFIQGEKFFPTLIARIFVMPAIWIVHNVLSMIF